MSNKFIFLILKTIHRLHYGCYAILILICSGASAEVSNITGVVSRVEVLTTTYIEEVPENRRVCEIQKVPITAKRKTTGVTDKKLFGAIIGGVLGSKLGEGSGQSAATALGALLGSSLSSGEKLNSDKLGGAILGGVAGAQVGSGSGNKAATAAGALLGSEIANSNQADIIGYEDREICEIQNIIIKKSIDRVSGYLLNILADNRELTFESKRSAQPGDVVTIRKTLIYNLQ